MPSLEDRMPSLEDRVALAHDTTITTPPNTFCFLFRLQNVFFSGGFKKTAFFPTKSEYISTQGNTF